LSAAGVDRVKSGARVVGVAVQVGGRASHVAAGVLAERLNPESGVIGAAGVGGREEVGAQVAFDAVEGTERGADMRGAATGRLRVKVAVAVARRVLCAQLAVQARHETTPVAVAAVAVQLVQCRLRASSPSSAQVRIMLPGR